MDKLIALWGEVRENWADMSVLIVALLGVVLAIIPGEVAALEKHPRWGKLWRSGLPALLLFVGITGFMQGCAQKKAFQQQISQLTSQVTIEATKEDITSLRNHLDDGLATVVDAIHELGGHKSVTRPAIKPAERAPAVVQHLRFTERRVASDKPELPYALQVIIQTDVPVERPRIQIDFSAPIGDGNFFVAGQVLTMMHRTQVSDQQQSFRLAFDFPVWGPQNPIVATILSKQDVHVAGIRNVPEF
jgi:hypothetical protein